MLCDGRTASMLRPCVNVGRRSAVIVQSCAHDAAKMRLPKLKEGRASWLDTTELGGSKPAGGPGAVASMGLSGWCGVSARGTSNCRFNQQSTSIDHNFLRDRERNEPQWLCAYDSRLTVVAPGGDFASEDAYGAGSPTEYVYSRLHPQMTGESGSHS